MTSMQISELLFGKLSDDFSWEQFQIHAHKIAQNGILSKSSVAFITLYFNANKPSGKSAEALTVQHWDNLVVLLFVR